MLRLLADDSLLYREIKSILDTYILQKDLDALQAWEIENKMEFHPSKCQVLRISNKLNPIINTYNIHDVTLKVYDSVKYLGVTIDSKLTWKDHTSNVYNKANFMTSF